MSGYNFVAVKGPELLSKWVGDSERAVKYGLATSSYQPRIHTHTHPHARTRLTNNTYVTHTKQ